jgi:hypothetical protein
VSGFHGASLEDLKRAVPDLHAEHGAEGPRRHRDRCTIREPTAAGCRPAGTLVVMVSVPPRRIGSPRPAVTQSSELEHNWLAYAREVLTDTTHRSACAAAGGSPAHPGVDAKDLRWPGYLGAGARRGHTVLAIGNVHRNFASGTLGVADRDLLVTVTRGWRDRQRSDSEYLAGVRQVYLAGLNGWRVGTHLRYALDVLGLDLSAIAYTNAARCQYPEIPPRLPRAAQTKLAVQAMCLRRFPIARLVDMLAPRAVLFTSTSAFDAATSVGPTGDTPWVCLHQFSGRLTRPARLASGVLPAETVRAVWARELAATMA